MTATVGQQTSSGAVSVRPLIELGTAFWAAKTLLSAVEVGLFTALATGPADEPALSHRLNLHPRCSRDFLDALVALGVLERAAGSYRNTAAADRYLDEQKATYIGGWMRLASKHLFRAWSGLTESLRTGKPHIGWDSQDYFERLYEDLEERRSFMAAMDAWTTNIAVELAEGLDWREHTTFVDVGGARGNLAACLIDAVPHLRGTVFDMPEIAPLFEEHITERGATDRIDFVAGNFFTDPLPTADVLLFGHILHDWDAAKRRILIKKAHDTLQPGGIVVIYDRMIDDDRRENATALLTCLNLLVLTPAGSEYTVAEGRSYARDAGFAEISTFALFDGLETALIARKTG
ncbi:MAG: hypothetical protein JO281_04465 [Pseudonocardiales bacterium]|nr:hypothetical protein [Pseudonocardiales bacterium]